MGFSFNWFSFNWFLGVLAVELWVTPYLLLFWPDIRRAWAKSRQARYARDASRDIWYT